MRRFLFLGCILIGAIGLTSGAVFGKGANKCGVERQKVKTSADSDAGKVNMACLVFTTVAALNNIAAPTRKELDAKQDSRFPAELEVYEVTAYVNGFKLEDDEDFHIVLADLNTKDTMVIEMPSEDCVPPALRNESARLRASWQARFGKATKKFKPMAVHKIEVRVMGIGFFDFIHGQTGVAKNGFELHRVLQWEEVRVGKKGGTHNVVPTVYRAAQAIGF